MKKTTTIWAIIALVTVMVIIQVMGIISDINPVPTNPILLGVLIFNVIGLVVFLICLYKLYFIKDNAPVWINIVFGIVVATKLIVLVLVMIAYSKTLGIDKIINAALPSLAIIIGLWISSYKALVKFIADKNSAQPIAQDPKSTSSKKIIAIVLVIIILGLAPTLLYKFVIVPQSNDSLVSMAVSKVMADAFMYSMDKRTGVGDLKESFLGFHSKVQDVKSPCGGSIIVNVSPDGSRVAILGKSCLNPSIYYCSALPPADYFSSNNMGSLARVPEALVSENKFDCGSK